MTDITWENPPTVDPKPRRESKYAPIADELRANEGIWALITDDGWLSLKSQIESATLAAFRPRGSFEARAVRGDDPAKGRVYARFVGVPPLAAPDPGVEFPDLPETDEIRRLEREHVAAALEGHRYQTWTGDLKRVSNFTAAAQFVRSMS